MKRTLMLLFAASTATGQSAPARQSQFAASRLVVGAVFASRAEWAANALFAEPGGEDDASGGLAGMMALAVELPRTTLRMSGGGGVLRHRRLSGLNTTLYSIGADANRRATPRLTLRAAAEARTTLARELLATEVTAAISPLSVTRTRSGSGGLRYALGPRTSAIVDAEHSSVAFDDPALADGSRQRVDASFERAVSGTLTATVRFEGSREVLRRDARQVYELATALAYRTRRFDLRGRIGSDVMTAPGTATRVLPAGELSIGAEGKMSSASLGYMRRVVQGYDVGRMQSSDELSARTGLRFSGSAELSITGTATRTADLDAGGTERRLYGGEAEFRQRIGPAVSLVGGAYTRRRTSPQQVSTHGFRLSLESRIGAS